MSRNAGQIIERGPDHYLLRVYLGTDGSGKRKYANRVVRCKKAEARKVLTAMLRDRDLGLLAEPSYRTLNEYLDHWLAAAAKPRLQASTLQDYVGQLDRYVRPSLGGLKLTAVTPVAIQRVYGDMLAGGLSARTVRLTHAILGNALKQAVKWRLLPLNPAEAVDLPKRAREEMRAMTEAEAARYLVAARDSHHGVLLAVLLTTGLRPSEALALQWSDVDLPAARLSVRRKIARKPGGWEVGAPKTAKSRRVVDLPAGTAALLAGHPRYRELVFDNGDGKPVNSRGVGAEHKRVLEHAGIDPRIRLYDLRHSHATLLLSAGVHPKIVSERLGHSTVTITLDTYSHVLPGMQRESAEKLDAMLFESTASRPARAAVN
jgi:integrase